MTAEPLSDLSDAALLERCGAGDAAAWEALLRRFRRLVYSVPARMGLDGAAADDVFQETFAALLEHLASIQDPARVGLWLAVTARRKALHRVTRSPAAREAALPEGHDPVDLADLPIDGLMRLERQHQARRALASLGERCRTLLEALYYQDPPLSYKEISRRLKLPIGSLGPTRARCFEKLRQALAEAGRG